MRTYFDHASKIVKNKKSLVNWLIGPIRAILADQQTLITSFIVGPDQLADIINLVEDKQLTQQIAIQQLIPNIKDGKQDVKELAAALNLLIVENSDELEGFVAEVLEKLKPQVLAYKNGKKGVLGLFVGEVMKLAKGKADPKKVNEIILNKLK
jgi:aspartyl-tRNA(Asn)/glutamyl-tRNA(Gln) amidotransferase subunit B